MKQITYIFTILATLVATTTMQLSYPAALTVFNKTMKQLDVTIYWEGNFSKQVTIPSGGKTGLVAYSNALSKITWSVPGTQVAFEVAIPSPRGITTGEMEIKDPIDSGKYVINFNQQGMYPQAPSRRVEVGFAKNKRIGQYTAVYNPKL